MQAQGFAPSHADVTAISQYVQQAIGQSSGKANVSGVTQGGVHYTASGDRFNITIVVAPYAISLVESPYAIKLNNGG
jgi:hypothetical protein